MKYIVYTDGSCLGNPGIGGWAYVVYDTTNTLVDSARQGYLNTTNNRMEMLAVINVIKKFKGSELEIHTDSKYVQQGITEWIHNWKARGWKGSDKNTVKNVDLWMQLDELVDNSVSFFWIKGHSNEEGNEMADRLAVSASKRGPHIEDEGFV